MSLFRIIWQDPRLLIFASSFFFTAMAACVKAVATEVPLFQIVFFRCLFSFVLLIPILKWQRISFRPRNAKMITFRSVMACLAISCNFYGISHLALGDAAMLLLTFPIFVAILSALFLGERPTTKLILLILVSWAGIALILRPQVQVLNFAGLVSLMAALFSSVDITSLKVLRRSDHAFLITFYFVGITALLVSPFMLESYVAPSAQAWGLLIGAGIAGTFAQVAISHAFGLGDASKLAPLSYFSVVLSFIVGLIFWDEIPTISALIGSAVVIYCCVRIALIEKAPPVLD